MFFPLGTDRPLHRPTRAVHAVIALTIAFHVFLALLAQTSPELANSITQALWVWRNDLTPWGPLTSDILHGGWLHLLGNMLFLWVFGPNVEDRFGRLGFLAFYAAGAYASGLAHTALDASPAIGASGAVAAVTGAYIVLFPRTRIRCLSLFFLIGGFWVPAWFFVALNVAMDLFAGGFAPNSGVAHFAHLGGYAFGFAVAFTLLASGKLQREPYDLFTLARQAQRRRQLRQAGAIREQQLAQVRADSKQPAPSLPDGLIESRTRVSSAVSERRLDDAADAYTELVAKYPDQRRATTLSRDAQYALATHLFQLGRHETCAKALELFAEAYPADPETPAVNILLARVLAEHLGETPRAVSLLRSVAEHASGEIAELAREELAPLEDQVNEGRKP